MEELQNGSPYDSLDEMDDDKYLTALQMLYDRYGAGRGNKIYEWVGFPIGVANFFDPKL